MPPKQTNSPLSSWLIAGLLLLLFSVAGCAEQNEVISAPVTLATTRTITVVPASATPTASTTPTLTATPTPPPTTTPTPTDTPTPLPSLTPTPLPTLTPLPIIPPEQRGQTYADLMSNNGGCELPCWWGFEMGSTPVDRVKQFYFSLGANIVEREYQNTDSVIEALFVDSQIENGIQTRHSFITQGGNVTEAEIQVAYDPNYQIESLLQRLGQPAEVWMWTIPEPYQGILPTRFRLYFPDQGVFVLYATGGVKVDDNVQVCFDELGGVTLLLWDPTIWDPNGTKGIVDRSNEGGTAFILEGFPIEEVSNWDVEQFYTVLSNPSHTECLETPANLWPSP